MAEKPSWEQIEKDRDKPVEMPLEPEEALRALLQVDPESEPVEAARNASRAPTNADSEEGY